MRAYTRYEKAFTLVELLVALMVTSIVLTAVVGLAYALGSVNDATGDTSQKQAQLRYATLRISDLIRHGKLICSASGTDIAIWEDDNGDNDGSGKNDNKINPSELVYIEVLSDKIRVLKFSPYLWATDDFKNHSFSIGDFEVGWAKSFMAFMCTVDYENIIPQCSNAQFLLDTAAPQTRFVSISFDLQENGVMRNYQINASLRSWAGHLLDSSGEIVNSDDD